MTRPVLPPYTRPLDWVPAVNDDVVDCPPFALVMPVSVDDDGVLHFTRFDGCWEKLPSLHVNGAGVIPALSGDLPNAGGQVYLAAGVDCQIGYLGWTPLPDAIWGPKEGSWYLWQGLPGFRILGGGSRNVVNASMCWNGGILARVTAYDPVANSFAWEQVTQAASGTSIITTTVPGGLSGTNARERNGQVPPVAFASVVVTIGFGDDCIPWFSNCCWDSDCDGLSFIITGVTDCGSCDGLCFYISGVTDPTGGCCDPVPPDTLKFSGFYTDGINPTLYPFTINIVKDSNSVWVGTAHTPYGDIVVNVWCNSGHYVIAMTGGTWAVGCGPASWPNTEFTCSPATVCDPFKLTSTWATVELP